MKVRYTSSDGRLSVEVESETQKGVFDELASFQEVFENTICGQCESNNVRFVVRRVDDNSFYEIHCQNCRHRFVFGQHKGKAGTLFPRRKDENGNYLPSGGWTKWTPPAKEE